MRCEDCGGLLSGTPNEYTALFHGLRLCQSCQDSMEAERDAYAAEMMGDCQFGVRINPGHWASINVHSFRRYLTPTVIETWCDLTVDLEQDGKLTTQTINCLACGQQSWRAIRG